MADEPTHYPSNEAAEKAKPVVVILIGPPGSGKSTFCNDVMSAARRPWLRICQDTISGGKTGTKLQCLRSASDALKDGISIFIDRCNLDREQRAEFVALGKDRADVHAVILDLPAQLCISRSVKRRGHEGNLQGGKAAAVVNRMLQKKELPKLSEGYSRITFCTNEKDVKGAVKEYSELGISNTLPGGNFGQKARDAKVQVGIMKFLKKVEVSEDFSCSGKDESMAGSCSKNSFPIQDRGKEEGTCFMELDKEFDSEENKNEFITQNIVDTLAFPSISTSDFQFNIEIASDVIVETVAKFLSKFGGNIRLVLVDLSENSKILNLVRAKAAQTNLYPNRFLTKVGDITRLQSESGLRCNVIANAANWRLMPGGGGVNATIYKAAGEGLEKATKEQSDALKPGNSLAVPLPPSSPLRQREGVTHVIHVVGPNMNPQRPNCLNNDYVIGRKVLYEAYTSLFRSFASIIHDNSGKNEGGGDPKTALELSSHNDEKVNLSDQKIKRDDWFDREANKKWKGFRFEHDSEDLEARLNPSSSYNVKKAASLGGKRCWAAWGQALHRLAVHPEEHKDVVLEEASDFVVVKDLYPKAKKHVLVVSRLEGLDCLSDVNRGHLQLLKKMHAAGVRWVESFLADDSSLIFRLGYHSVPSMRQLHLHVISQDFNSSHLKNKKHWNSFNTPFFRDSADVIEETEKHGVPVVRDDDGDGGLLSAELRCHRCRSVHPSIPRLKSHIANCNIQNPSDLFQNGRLFTYMRIK